MFRRQDRQAAKAQAIRLAPDFAVATSPVVDRGLLVAHIGTNRRGALTALDAATGVEKWSWKGDGPAYVSLILANLGGTRQVGTQTQHNIVGVAAATGGLLWHILFSTPYEHNMVTPVLYQETLLFSGLDNGVMGVTVLKHGSKWVAETVWQNKDWGMYIGSPVVSGGLLFGLSYLKRGQFFCLGPRNGATLWTSEGRQAG